MVKIIKSVVLATEDVSLKQLLNRILIKHDYAIVAVESAIQSILNILEKDFEFVILDFNSISPMSYDVLYVIKKTRPRLPIVVITADNSTEKMRKFAEIGIFYCILKPIQIKELEKVILALQTSKLKKVEGAK